MCVWGGGGGGFELRPPSPLIYVRAMICSKAEANVQLTLVIRL